MGITANSGPQIVYGTVVSASGATMEYNDQRGPSLIDLGDGLLDPRSQYNYGYQPGQQATQQTYGFWSQQATVDYIPGTISSNNIAVSQVPAAGTAITLAASGALVTAVSCIIAPETGKVITGTLLCIDTPCGGSSAAAVTFGQSNSISIWNPNSVCGRAIAITGSTQNDGGAVWSIAGRDAYGFKVTETLAGSTAGSTAAAGITLVSKKTYKYISAITPVNSTGTLGSTLVMVGTADTYGFPFIVQSAPYATIWLGPSSAQTLITVAGANHTYGSSLLTATATNGDVRGTYASTVASNSTTAAPVRVTMFVQPQVGASPLGPTSGGLGGVTATSFYGLFGATQFSSV
jgi:hypothetical protein